MHSNYKLRNEKTPGKTFVLVMMATKYTIL